MSVHAASMPGTLFPRSNGRKRKRRKENGPAKEQEGHPSNFELKSTPNGELLRQSVSARDCPAEPSHMVYSGHSGSSHNGRPKALVAAEDGTLHAANIDSKIEFGQHSSSKKQIRKLSSSSVSDVLYELDPDYNNLSAKQKKKLMKKKGRQDMQGSSTGGDCVSNEQEQRESTLYATNAPLERDPACQKLTKKQRRKLRRSLDNQQHRGDSLNSNHTLQHGNKRSINDAECNTEIESQNDLLVSVRTSHDSNLRDGKASISSKSRDHHVKQASQETKRSKKEKNVMTKAMASTHPIRENLRNSDVSRGTKRKRHDESGVIQDHDVGSIVSSIKKHKQQELDGGSYVSGPSDPDKIRSSAHTPMDLDGPTSSPSTMQRSHELIKKIRQGKKPQKQYGKAPGQISAQKSRKYRSAEYVFDSDDERTEPSADGDLAVSNTADDDETPADLSTTRVDAKKPLRRLPVAQLEEDASVPHGNINYKKKAVHRPSKAPKLGADNLRHGPYGDEEIQTIYQFERNYCNSEKLSHNDFVARLHDSAHNSTHIQRFWKEMRDIVNGRDVRSLQRFCRRHWPSKQLITAPFSPEDDKELINLVNLHGSRWVKIGELMNRVPEVVRDRHRNVLKNKTTRTVNTWSDTEVIKLRHAMGETGALILEGLGTVEDLSKHIYWSTVSEKMHGSRGRAQLAYKWNVLQSKGLVSLAEEVHAASQRLGINANVSLADLTNMSRKIEELPKLKGEAEASADTSRRPARHLQTEEGNYEQIDTDLDSEPAKRANPAHKPVSIHGESSSGQSSRHLSRETSSASESSSSQSISLPQDQLESDDRSITVEDQSSEGKPSVASKGCKSNTDDKHESSEDNTSHDEEVQRSEDEADSSSSYSEDDDSD